MPFHLNLILRYGFGRAPSVDSVVVVICVGHIFSGLILGLSFVAILHLYAFTVCCRQLPTGYDQSHLVQLAPSCLRLYVHQTIHRFPYYPRNP
jgi:hypothetical protein